MAAVITPRAVRQAFNQAHPEHARHGVEHAEQQVNTDEFIVWCECGSAVHLDAQLVIDAARAIA